MPYGIVLIGLMAAAFIAAIMGVSAFSQETVEGLKTGLMYGLPINLGMMALLTLLEFVLPAAGQRKPLKRYILILNIGLLGSLAGSLLTAMVGASLVALGSILRLGWIDLRFSTGHGAVAVVLAFLLSQLIWDFFYYWLHRLQHLCGRNISSITCMSSSAPSPLCASTGWTACSSVWPLPCRWRSCSN